jgi:hypothetical protein
MSAKMKEALLFGVAVLVSVAIVFAFMSANHDTVSAGCPPTCDIEFSYIWNTYMCVCK